MWIKCRHWDPGDAAADETVAFTVILMRRDTQLLVRAVKDAVPVLWPNDLWERDCFHQDRQGPPSWRKTVQKVKEKRSVMKEASMARGEKSQHGGSYSDRSGKGQVHMARGGVLFWVPWEARYRCGRMCMVHLQTSHGWVAWSRIKRESASESRQMERTNSQQFWSPHMCHGTGGYAGHVQYIC